MKVVALLFDILRTVVIAIAHVKVRQQRELALSE